MRATTVGIVSIGDMGLGMANLLKGHDYRVVTVAEGRSEHTLARIHAAGIEALSSDQELVIQADYILSILPPRNALATAERIAGAYRQPDTASRRQELEDVNHRPNRSDLFYLDLNAKPARWAQQMAALYEPTSIGSLAGSHFLDGGIIGGPPKLTDGKWKKPSVVLSGALVSPRVGAASTLKMSFAALTKGLTALSILSFSTAQRESLLPELLEHLDTFSPHTGSLARAGVIGMSPKAYRWVDEMRGIGETFDSEGGWDGVGASIYGGIAEVYRAVAEDTILGQERVEQRRRGTSVEDAAGIIAQRGTEHDIGNSMS
ncbi:Dehydrogenase multihelical [Penicillium cinerascens]|uniref:Dehydrogenase multihelical n=1 Tax=Penicillium cinerascens TaxID=70096 RepID=A0A9W9N363_9EURO|nr:Dehydrogenase multihelical [Penicillium cinerascens]KAJ5212337.1 Dehydrogenase multihelical [Penicillium cinerascens]